MPTKEELRKIAEQLKEDLRKAQRDRDPERARRITMELPEVPAEGTVAVMIRRRRKKPTAE